MSAKHSGTYDFELVIPSRPARDLVRGLLEVDVSLRLTIDQVLDHEWMIEADDYLERFDLSLSQAQHDDATTPRTSASSEESTRYMKQ